MNKTLILKDKLKMIIIVIERLNNTMKNQKYLI